MAAAAAQVALEARLLEGRGADDAMRQLVADLVGFHRREEKPAWWAFFDRQECSVDELIDDGECLGGLEADGEDWITPVGKSLTFRYRYPEQETKLGVGNTVHIASTGERAGIIEAMDEANRLLVVKRGAASGELPRSLALMPGGPLDSQILRQTVRVFAEGIANGTGRHPHIEAFLRRTPPHLQGREPGQPIVSGGGLCRPAAST